MNSEDSLKDEARPSTKGSELCTRLRMAELTVDQEKRVGVDDSYFVGRKHSRACEMSMCALVCCSLVLHTRVYSFLHSGCILSCQVYTSTARPT